MTEGCGADELDGCAWPWLTCMIEIAVGAVAWAWGWMAGAVVL